MFKDKKFILLLSAVIIIIVLIGIMRPREIDWTETYAADDKIPFGSFVTYHSLPDIFSKQNVSTNTDPIRLMLEEKWADKSTLLFVQNYFNPPVKDLKVLLNFVADGGNVFISAKDISQRLLDTLNLREQYEAHMFSELVVDSNGQRVFNFTNPALKTDSGYSFNRGTYTNYYAIGEPEFYQKTTRLILPSDITVLGTGIYRHPNFIRVKYGDGFIFMHNFPQAFTNYYMLTKPGAEYASKCLSYIPQNSNVIWDEFYKTQTNRFTQTPLKFILSSEPLRWAYYTGLFALLLYIAFNIKRRQRIIPVLDPNVNASLEFTRTVGSLYFNQSNHKDISYKKINFFLEFLRNKYGVDTTEMKDEFVRKLSLKSGIEPRAIHHLLNVMKGVDAKKWISDTELIDLNNAIQYFKTHCQ